MFEKGMLIQKKVIPRRLYLFLMCISFVCLLGVWTLLSHTMPSADIFLPSPYKTLTGMFDLFTKHEFHKDILASIWRVTAGFTLALLISIPIGILIGINNNIEAVIQPINEFFRYLPIVALIPLTILWVGIGSSQKILIIFLGTVFQLIPMVSDTVSRVPKNLIELGYTIGYKSRYVVTRVVIPWCAPQIYDHARIALGWSWSYLIVAELVAAETGIGHVIIQAQRFIKTEYVMAGILTIGLIGLLFDYILRTPKSRLFPWV